MRQQFKSGKNPKDFSRFTRFLDGCIVRKIFKIGYMYYIFCALYFALGFMGYAPIFIQALHGTHSGQENRKPAFYKGLFLILTVAIGTLLGFYAGNGGWYGMMYVGGVLPSFLVSLPFPLAEWMESICAKFLY